MSTSVTSPTTPPAGTRAGGFLRRYGAKPWHLLTLLACFALTAYVASRVLMTPSWFRILVWFVGVAVAWDLVLGPAMALVDRGLRSARLQVRGVPLLNHVRFPALLSALLLVMFAPLVLQRSEPVYRAKAGLLQDPYLDRWLAVTAVLFAGSAVLYAVRVARAGR